MACEHASANLRRYLKLLRERSYTLGDDLFSDPAWIIAIEIYIAQSEGKPISIKSACHGSGAPSTTALRYIARLERAGLVSRHPDVLDQRRINLRLTDLGQQRLSALLEFFNEGTPVPA